MDLANGPLLQENLKAISNKRTCINTACIHETVFYFMLTAGIWPRVTRSVQAIKRILAGAGPLQIADLHCFEARCDCRDLPAMQSRILDGLSRIEMFTKGLYLDSISGKYWSSFDELSHRPPND